MNACKCVRLITVCVCMCVCVCVRLISVCGEALVAPGATLAPLIASMNPKEAGPSGRPPTPGPTQHTRVNELREKFMNELKHIPREYTHIHTHSHGHNTHTIAHTHTHTHTIGGDKQSTSAQSGRMTNYSPTSYQCQLTVKYKYSITIDIYLFTYS